MIFIIFHHVIYTETWPGSLARFRSFAEVGKTWLPSEHAQRAQQNGGYERRYMDCYFCCYLSLLNVLIDRFSLIFRGMETLQGAPGSRRAITVQEKS